MVKSPLVSLLALGVILSSVFFSLWLRSFLMRPVKLAFHRTGRVESTKRKQATFYDAFSDFDSWQQYGDGTIQQSNERHRVGRHSLKKIGPHGDPDGGFREIDSVIRRGFVFSGWIYSPSGRPQGKADRLAIEDSAHNGYGFSVNLTDGKFCIERRENGEARHLGAIHNIDLSRDGWYRFEFHVREGTGLTLRFYDSSGRFVEDTDASDGRHNSFDRVAVHGGFPFYVDELKIELIGDTVA